MHRHRLSNRPGRSRLAGSLIGLSFILLLATGTGAPAQTFLRGDTNADGIVDVSDGVFTVLYLFGGGRPPPCLDAADADDSGEIEVTDAVHTYDFLFASGSLIPPPGHLVCGLDPTPDALSCEHSPACAIPESLAVGPQGGRLEFSSGVVLDVPPGAVSDLTAIALSPLPGGVDTLLNRRTFASSDKRAVGGFVATVDGSAVRLSILASIPVDPIEPGGFPRLAEVDLETGEYWLIPGDLTYLPDESRIEADLGAFFGAGDGAGGQEGSVAGSALVAVELSGIPADDPCRSGRIEVKSSSVDFHTAGEGMVCGIVSDRAEVTFPDCPGSPTEIVYISEVAGTEPTKCDFVVEVRPRNGIIAVGETLELAATVRDRNTGRSFPAEFVWASSNPGVVTVDVFSGRVIGASPGTAVITARTGADYVKGTATVEVVDYGVATQPAGPLAVGETEQLKAVVTDPEGRIIPFPTLEWESLSPGVLDVDDSGIAAAVSAGTARVRACLVDPPICGDWITICVGNPADRIAISPDEGLTTVGGIVTLEASRVDAAGDEVDCGTSHFDWSIDDETVVAFQSISSDPVVRLQALSEGRTTVSAAFPGLPPGTATVFVVPERRFYVEIEPAEVSIPAAAGLYLKAIAKDIDLGTELFSIDPLVRAGGEVLSIPYSDPDLSFTLIEWLSADPSIATVDDYGKVHGVSPGTVNITAIVLPEPSFHGIPGESAVAAVNVRPSSLVKESGGVWLSETEGDWASCSGVFTVPPRHRLRIDSAPSLGAPGLRSWSLDYIG